MKGPGEGGMDLEMVSGTDDRCIQAAVYLKIWSG